MKKEIENYFQSLDDYCKYLLDKAIKSNADDSEKVKYLVEELQKFEDRRDASISYSEHTQKVEESLSKEQNNISQEQNNNELSFEEFEQRIIDDNNKDNERLLDAMQEEFFNLDYEGQQAYLYQERLEERQNALEMAEKEGKTIDDDFGFGW